jgi:hypothetical protein
MDGAGDVVLPEFNDLTAPTFTGGVLQATTTGPKAMFLAVYQEAPSAFNLTRDAQHSIDSARYSRLSAKMRLRSADGSSPACSTRPFNAFFFEKDNAIPARRFRLTRFPAFTDDAW